MVVVVAEGAECFVARVPDGAVLAGSGRKDPVMHAIAKGIEGYGVYYRGFGFLRGGGAKFGGESIRLACSVVDNSLFASRSS